MFKTTSTLATVIILTAPFFLNTSMADPLPSLGTDAGDISLYDEYVIGRKVFARIKESQLYFDYPELEDFIMDRINPILNNEEFIEEQKYSDFQAANKIKLFFIDDSNLNAFALPGNFIGINVGLILKVDDHREILSVFCHELAHLTQRHVSRMYARKKDSSDIMLLTALLSALIVGSNQPDAAVGALSLGQTLAMKRQMSFSRHAENEADQKGLNYLEKISVNPKYMIDVLNRMQQHSYLEGRDSSASWLSTHPLTVDRLAGLNARIKNRSYEFSPQKNEVNEQSFDYLLATFSGKQGTWKKQEFDSDFEKNYYEFWNAFNRDEIKKAQRLLKKLKNDEGGDKTEALQNIIFLSEVKFHLKTGEFDKAESLIENINQEKIQRWLLRALYRLRLEVYFSAEREKDFDLLGRQVAKLYPKDDWFWRKRASMEFKKGNLAKAHFFVAKGFLAIGNVAGAFEQLTLASATKSKNQKILRLKIEAELDRLKKFIRRDHSPLG